MRTGQVSVVEALVRWRHPRRGFLTPAAFLPAAEGSPLMGPLTLRVLSEALRRLHQWDVAAAGAADVAVAVNIAASTFTDSRFAGRVLAALHQRSIDPGRLELEITEHELPVEVDSVRAGMTPLVDAGVRISIDDFGTGYSSLSRLTTLPVSKVKIDRSFVSGLGLDRSADVIVASTIELGRGLGLQVVAEGVETELQYRRLLELGCDFAQGYFVCPPVHALRFVRWTGARGELPVAAPVTRSAPIAIARPASRRRVRKGLVVSSVAVAASAATLTAAAAFPGRAGDVIGAVRSVIGAEPATTAAPRVVPVPVPVAGSERAAPPADAVDDVPVAAPRPDVAEPGPEVSPASPDRVTDVLGDVVERTRAIVERIRPRRSTQEQPPPPPPPAEEQPPPGQAEEPPAAETHEEPPPPAEEPTPEPEPEPTPEEQPQSEE